MIYVTEYDVKLYFDDNPYHLQCKQEQDKSSDVESIPHYIVHKAKVIKYWKQCKGKIGQNIWVSRV